MIRRKHAPPKPRPSHWVVSTEATEHDITKGQELTFADFTNVQGSNPPRPLMRRAKFIEAVTTYHGDGNTWYTVVELGDENGSGPTRSIHPHQVRKVWTKTKANISRKARLKKRKTQ